LVNVTYVLSIFQKPFSPAPKHESSPPLQYWRGASSPRRRRCCTSAMPHATTMTVCLCLSTCCRRPPQDQREASSPACHLHMGTFPLVLQASSLSSSSLGVPQPSHTPTPESGRLPMLSWCSTRCGTRTSSLQRHCRLLRRPRALTPRVVSHRLHAQEQLQPRQGRVHLQLPAAASTQA
jgi:hypothetical protein